MDQPITPDTSNPNLSQATAKFLAKNKAIQDSLNKGLRTRNAASSAKLTALTGEDSLLEIPHELGATKAAINEESAKRLEAIMKDFDAEVGGAEEREQVEKEMTKSTAEFGLQMSFLGPFKDAIARYEARDR